MTEHYNESAMITIDNELNVIALLKADHEKVRRLFATFENASSNEEKKKLVTEICNELSIHTQLEEEIFYPAFKAAHRDKLLVPEAKLEHRTINELIAQIEDKEPNGEDYDAKVKVLSQYVMHHVREEHSQMFTAAKTAPLNLNELGALMLERKAELLEERD